MNFGRTVAIAPAGQEEFLTVWAAPGRLPVTQQQNNARKLLRFEDLSHFSFALEQIIRQLGTTPGGYSKAAGFY